MSLRACLVTGLVLLQGADFVLTWRLLTTRDDIVEANPVALALLERHGWAGAAALKVGTTAVALACVFAIGRRRPIFSRGLLAAFCVLMLGVVGYSGALLARPAEADRVTVAAGWPRPGMRVPVRHMRGGLRVGQPATLVGPARAGHATQPEPRHCSLLAGRPAVGSNLPGQGPAMQRQAAAKAPPALLRVVARPTLALLR